MHCSELDEPPIVTVPQMAMNQDYTVQRIKIQKADIGPSSTHRSYAARSCDRGLIVTLAEEVCCERYRSGGAEIGGSACSIARCVLRSARSSKSCDSRQWANDSLGKDGTNWQKTLVNQTPTHAQWLRRSCSESDTCALAQALMQWIRHSCSRSLAEGV